MPELCPPSRRWGQRQAPGRGRAGPGAPSLTCTSCCLALTSSSALDAPLIWPYMTVSFCLNLFCRENELGKNTPCPSPPEAPNTRDYPQVSPTAVSTTPSLVCLQLSDAFSYLRPPSFQGDRTVKKFISTGLGARQTDSTLSC